MITRSTHAEQCTHAKESSVLPVEPQAAALSMQKSKVPLLRAASSDVLPAAIPMSLPRVELFDGRASGILRSDTAVRLVAGGFSFTEGPAYEQRSGWWYFSDIPESRIWRWHEDNGLELFRSPSHKANGNCISPQGDLVTCEHETRRVSLTKLRLDDSPMLPDMVPDRQESSDCLCEGQDSSCTETARYTVAVSQFEGKKLNSPNDVIVRRSDGTIWFTDPDYGVVARMGHGETIEQSHNHVFCFKPATQQLISVSCADCRPNGLCFDPQERFLYVADSGAWFQRVWHDDKPHHVVRYTIEADGSLSHRHVIVQLEREAGGFPDGIRCDVEGNIYVANLEGVHIYTPAGELLAKIRTPETTANMCFGGKENKTLLLTATSCVWAVEMAVTGAGTTSELKEFVCDGLHMHALRRHASDLNVVLRIKYTILYYTILYHATLGYTIVYVVYDIILVYILLCNIISYSIALYIYTKLYHTILYYIVLYHTVFYYTVRYYITFRLYCII